MHRRFLPSVCILAAALSYSLAASAASLYPGTTFLAGNTPGAVVMAQLRPGSGLQDIVEIGQTGYIDVLLNNGDGTYAAPVVNYVSDGSPRALAVADVNGDGIPDIIVANEAGDVAGAGFNGNDVTVFIGLGNGFFTGPIGSQVNAGIAVPAPTYAVGNTPIALAVGDLNGDGFPDIVVANSLDNTVSVLLNNGNGTFQTQKVYLVGDYPDCVAIADVDNDGHPDILVDNALDNTFAVLFGVGDGTFRVPRVLSMGAVQNTTTPQLQTFVAGALRPGGPIDVIVSVLNGNTSSVAVLVNDGQGAFTIGRTYPAGLDPETLLLVDVNKDGNLDLVTGSSADAVVSVLFGNGDGTFGAPNTYAAAGISGSPGQQALAAADVNGDGYPDIVIANPTNQTMQVLYNAGAGSRFPAGTFHRPGSYPVGGNPSAVATGKLTASGNWDVVVANAADNEVGVLLNSNDGKGTLQPMVTYPVSVSPQAVALAATRGSGQPLDIITANFGDGTVSVLLGNGDGTFQSQKTYTAVPPTPGATVLGVVVADMNGDGIPDLIVTNGVSNTFGILLGNGDGSFQPIQSFPSDNTLLGIAVADVTGDGVPDVVTVGGGITIFQNTTTQCKVSATFNCSNAITFTGKNEYSTLGTAVSVADVNGDGTPDLLIADYTRGNLDVLLGNPASPGSFLTPIAYSAGQGATSVVLTGPSGPLDVNGDGNIDAIVTTALFNAVNVMFGNGKGAFLGNLYPMELNPRSVAVADFNNDGKPDVVVANHGSNTITVMLQIPTAVSGDTAPVAQSQTLIVPDGNTPGSAQAVATDADSTATLTYGVVVQPGNGSVSLDSATGFYEYQANPEFVGTDSFSYQVSDGVKLSNIATVTLTVQTNSAVTSGTGVAGIGDFGILSLLVLAPFLRRRRRAAS